LIFVNIFKNKIEKALKINELKRGLVEKLAFAPIRVFTKRKTHQTIGSWRHEPRPGETGLSSCRIKLK